MRKGTSVGMTEVLVLKLAEYKEELAKDFGFEIVQQAEATLNEVVFSERVKDRLVTVTGRNQEEFYPAPAGYEPSMVPLTTGKKKAQWKTEQKGRRK